MLALSVTPVSLSVKSSTPTTIFIQAGSGPRIWACKLEAPQDRTVSFVIGGAFHSITQIVGQPDAPLRQELHQGMLVQTAPSLPAHATFTQRAEFATNTHGWLAADEMTFATQLLQWSTTAGPQYSPPVYWDPTQSDFDEAPFGPMMVQDHGTTYIPILAGDHWCALEVIKSAQQTNNITVVTVQVPQHLHTRIIMILARFLDIGPHRMNIIHHNSTCTHIYVGGSSFSDGLVTMRSGTLWLPRTHTTP